MGKATNNANENSTSYIDVEFRDKDDVLQAPTSARYRIDCLTNDSQVLDWTSIPSPTSQETITISKTHNAIINAVNAFERRIVTIEATYGADDGLNHTVKYQVNGLNNVP